MKEQCEVPYSLFVELFDLWKTELKVSEEDKMKWLDRIEKMIAKRVVAII